MSEILPNEFRIVQVFCGRKWTNARLITVNRRNREVTIERETSGWYGTYTKLVELDAGCERLINSVWGNPYRWPAHEDKIPCRYAPCLDDGLEIFDFYQDKHGADFPLMQPREDAFLKAEYLAGRLTTNDIRCYLYPLRSKLGREPSDSELLEYKFEQEGHQEAWLPFLDACREFWRLGALSPVTKVRPLYYEEKWLKSKADGDNESMRLLAGIPKTFGGRQRVLLETFLARRLDQYEEKKLNEIKRLMLWGQSVPADQRKTLEKKVKRAEARGVVSSAFARGWFKMHAAVAQIFTGRKPNTQQNKQPRRKQTA